MVLRRGRGRGVGGQGRNGGGTSATGGRGRAHRTRGRRGLASGRSWQHRKVENETSEEENWDQRAVSSVENLKLLFIQPAPFSLHLKAQEENKCRYLATIQALSANKVEILQGSKIIALAAAWARHDHDFANKLLLDAEAFTVAEVLKAFQLLDAGRAERFQEKKLAKMKQAMLTAGKQGKTRMGRKIAKIKVNP